MKITSFIKYHSKMKINIILRIEKKNGGNSQKMLDYF